MMRPHATADEIQALRRRELDPTAIVALTRHLAECAQCAALARDGVGEQAVSASLVAGAATANHPDLEEEIFPYVDGTLVGERRAMVEEHLRGCFQCRQDVDDARSERTRLMRRPQRGMLWGAVAAAVAAAAIGMMFLRHPEPAPVPSNPVHVVTPNQPPARRSDWESLVNDTIAKGHIVPPASFTSVQNTTEPLRGTSSAQHADLSPSNVVVATTTPRFKWPSHGQSSAVVSVYAGADLVAASPKIKATEWTIDRPLQRGQAYVWQVEVVHKNQKQIMPAPPDPPATFRVVDDKSWNAIAEARQIRPDDHLLIAILEARAGLKQEALDDLARVEDAKARELEKSVRKW